jgi:predicted SnoaL-like aldol condensation-catalyzing enzyme
MNHKQIASEFLKLAASGKVQEAYDNFISPQFIHHNQYFKGDRSSLMKAMQEASLSSPNKSFTIKHIYEDHPHIIAHSLVIKDGMQISVVHIFKFDGDLIVELWDIGQQILPNCPNENGLF